MNNETTNILIVDDDVDVLQVIDVALKDMDIKTVLSTSPHQALELLDKESFDIIITDLKMPDIDGVELIRKAREKDPHIVAIVVTGYGNIENVVEATQSGSFAYILKPFKFAVLRRIIEQAIEYKRALEENILLRKSINLYEAIVTSGKEHDMDVVIKSVLNLIEKEFVDIEAYIVRDVGNKVYSSNGKEFPDERFLTNWCNVIREKKEPIIIQKRDLTRFKEYHSVLILPMMWKEAYVGALFMFAVKPSRKFTTGDIKKGEMFVSIVSMRLFMEDAVVSTEIWHISGEILSRVIIGESMPSVIHRLNNPLTAISISADSLRNKKRDPSISQIVDRIDGAIDKLEEVSEILHKIYYADDVQELVHLKDVINDVEKLLSFYLNRRGINLKVSIKNNLPPVIVNYSGLSMLLMSLLFILSYNGRGNINIKGKTVNLSSDRAISIEFSGQRIVKDNPWVDVVRWLKDKMEKDIISINIVKDKGKIEVLFPLPVICP